MITLHFDHSQVEVPTSELVQMLKGLYSPNHEDVLDKYIEAVAKDVVSKQHGNVPHVAVWVKSDNYEYAIHIWAVGLSEPMRIKWDAQGVRPTHQSIILGSTDLKKVIRFLKKHHEDDLLEDLLKE